MKCLCLSLRVSIQYYMYIYSFVRFFHPTWFTSEVQGKQLAKSGSINNDMYVYIHVEFEHFTERTWVCVSTASKLYVTVCYVVTV